MYIIVTKTQCMLISVYIRYWSAIIANDQAISTPLCFLSR